jgi:serine/threonine protein kinase/tetratricopeptide (TPR) repeat protein
MTERDIFIAALQREDLAERRAYLDEACAGLPDLRQQVEDLLQLYEGAGSFLENRPAEPAATGPYQDAAETASSPEVPGTVIGPYKLLEQLGEGGMGTVWMAQQTEPVRRTVAVKLLKPGMDSKQVLARFEAERQALALMDHPNIARVLDAGAGSDGRPCFVMELVKGIPITKFCDQQGLTPRQRLELFVPVCLAVQHAHQKGIIHRDLKPSNVLVALYDDRPVPKVIDFGVAKATGQQLTEQTLHTGFGAIVGTLEYMSPEQASFNQLDVDTRSDIYSLGVLLYELLAGSPPFHRKELEKAGMMEMLRVIREQEPSKPSAKLSTAEGLPTLAARRGMEPKRLTALMRGELDWIVMKALEKDRSRRYESANSFAVDVQRYLAGEAVLAVPPSAGYRLRKFARKNRTALITATTLVLLLVGGVAVSTWQAVRATEAEVDAKHRADSESRAKSEAERQKKNAEAARDEAKRRLEMVFGIVSDIDYREVRAARKPLEAELASRLVELAKRLEARPPNDPEELAGLQIRLARTLVNLGHPRDAIPLCRQAWETYKAQKGTDHPASLTAMTALATAYQHDGKLDLALPLFRDAFDLSRAALGPDHADTIRSMNDLALAYLLIGRLDLALPLLEESLKLTQAKRGADNPDTLTCMTNLASAYIHAKKFDLALPLCEQTWKRRKAILGADHPDTLTSMNTLASGYVEAGKMELAMPLFKESLRLSKARYGADHPNTLTCLNNQAAAYQFAGKPDLAVPILEESLKQLKATVGSDHPDTLITLTNLALAHQALDKEKRALPLFQEAAAGLEKLRFQHVYASRIVNGLIVCLQNLGQSAEAEAWGRKWLAIVKAQSGAESAVYADELAEFGLLRLAQSKWADAETVLRECLVLHEKIKPDAWTTFNTRSMLGDALLGQKKYADAEPLLVSGYAGMRARTDTIPQDLRTIRLIQALERLVLLYEGTGRNDEGLRWRKEINAVKAGINK